VRFGETVIRFADPDGLLIELIASERRNAVEPVRGDSAIPTEYQLGGFHCPTLELQRAGLTVELLTDVFGFELIGEEGGRRRFGVDSTMPNKQLDLVERADGSFGHIAAGTVHHIAFSAATDHEQQQWREQLSDLGFNVTPIVDRQYFHSIYFREPGGILFEIATDAPGFATDESVEQLGQNLKLPPQYEEHRQEIERSLPPISMECDSGSVAAAGA
jgi:glyoxalase family protein